MNAIFISDPVARVSYTLRPDTMTADKNSFTGAKLVLEGGGSRVVAMNDTVHVSGPVSVAERAPSRERGHQARERRRMARPGREER